MADLQIAHGKLWAFLNGCLHLFNGTPPPYLYHYTTEAGLLGIVKSGRFWATNAQDQNDATELRYAISIFNAHLERVHANDYLDDACELFAAMRPHLEIRGTSKIHTISLVADGDNVNLWRLYGDRGSGASLAFSTGSVSRWGDGWYLLRCCYSEIELGNFCRYALSFIRQIYLDDLRADSCASASDYAALFMNSIAWFAPTFKPSIYSDEQEWRLVKLVEDGERLYRADGRAYVDAPQPDAGRLEIGAVCLGPNNQIPDTIERVREALASSGFGATKLHLSPKPKILSVPRSRFRDA